MEGRIWLTNHNGSVDLHTPIQPPLSTSRLRCNGNFALSSWFKGRHKTCSPESQPDNKQKKYGGGALKSIKWFLQKLVQSSDALCSVLVAGGKLGMVVAGEEKINSEYDEWFMKCSQRTGCDHII